MERAVISQVFFQVRFLQRAMGWKTMLMEMERAVSLIQVHVLQSGLVRESTKQEMERAGFFLQGHFPRA